MAETTEEWRSSVDGNLTVTLLTLKGFLPGMLGCGGGSIVTNETSPTLWTSTSGEARWSRRQRVAVRTASLIEHGIQLIQPGA
ncbi:MAG: hypothetical protein ACRDJN_17405 [Chloroflexota bacterium]